MGRSKFSQSEADNIRKLLRLKCSANRFKQKVIRHELRTKYEFNISDFGTPGQAFSDVSFDEALQRGAIQILDDATIADMKAKRARDKERDAAAKAAAEPYDENADWQKAMEEWERGVKSEK
ncbi:MAG: hypothetical protein IKN75_01080 [Prevotella sp.]|nr:hypothetical protein [Prevotella sp.]